ncbi:MAG: hypothetical protein ACI808_000601 [Paraglaciecola sp.]|jgi:hypothetical protein
MSLFIKLNTYRRLGFKNLGQVFWYLIRLKSGWLKRNLKIENAVKGPFFETLSGASLAALSVKHQAINISPEPLLFGWYELSTDHPPQWLKSVLSNKSFEQNNQHWSEISDFSSGVGDIKGVWEMSRFNWALNFTQRYIQEQNEAHLRKLNLWIADWSSVNPANQGPNWKCAQEASFRVMHLAASALMLQQSTPNASLQVLLTQHLRRIYPTLGYAMAQDNNHGTSEAAAMFIGASWLLQADPANNEAQRWLTFARQYLHNRVFKLIMADGSFSQYSVNYHRLMLDSLSLVELWRRALELPTFSTEYIQRIGQATLWLFELTDLHSGDAPNLGANDGAHIVNFTNSMFRDFRPSVELSAQLFLNKSAFTQPACQWLGSLFDLIYQRQLQKSAVAEYPDGGFGILRNDSVWCLLRVPKFRFRPSQADCMHLDLWLDGLNLFPDAGSFSYNTEEKWLNYFSGSIGHNTVQFDGREQMPKVSRFLFGCWPHFETFKLKEEHQRPSVLASYTDWCGATHQRFVEFHETKIKIVDTVAGFSKVACLRWRLADLDWTIDGHSIESKNIRVDVEATKSLIRFDMAHGVESRYYGKKQDIQVLELDVVDDAQITTIISWK